MRNVITLLLLVFSSGILLAQVCPSVSVNPSSVSMCSGCTTLTATVQGSVATTSYSVSNIPYNPFPFNTGTPVLIGVDDQWSSAITLPFCFEFYGNSYTQCIIGSNGCVGFNVANAGNFNSWTIGAAIPSATPADMMNTIMGPWHDIDPGVGGAQYYELQGTAPCRRLVVSWYHVPMFLAVCNSMQATHQIVLYETTNIIEIYIQNKPLCIFWNSGAAIEGIQNSTGTQAVVVPGRNYPTQWTATNDGKRFTPTGAPQYTLTWYNGSTPIGNNLSVTVCPNTTTTYTAELVNNSCNPVTLTAQATVTIAPQFTINVTATPAACGGNNGSATVSITSGGSPPFTYSWSPTGGNSSTASNLPAGNYTVTVTNSAGCTVTASVTVPNTSGPAAFISASTNVLCFGGNTGSATVTAIFGSPPYTYSWSPIGGNAATANNLPAGNYTVTITDANGCTTIAAVTITQPPAIFLATSSVQATCGQSNGSATVSASGGTPGYSYSWNTIPVQTTSSATNLSAGNYTITVTDANGCTSTASVIVGNAQGPTATISASTNVLCNGGNTGSATVNVTGGTPSYTYAWSPTGGNSSTANNLPAGNYTVIVTDANGCTTTAVVIITQPPAIALTTSSVQSTCGQSNGSATVSASGGTPTYSYSWNTTPVQTTSNATGLPAGNYTVTVTDANGCIATASVIVGNASGPTASITASVNVLCNGGNTGSATVSVTGGSPPYSYTWSPTGGNSSTATNLSAGNYTVIVTDANGCTTTAVVIITQPPAIALTTSSVQSTCGQSNGSATVSASGGTPTYSYSWNTTPVQTTSNASGLPAGNYIVTVMDANGCISTANVIVGNSSGPTASITASVNVLCNGGNTGSATVTVTGGTPSYTYAWSPTGGNSSTATNLPAGNYTVIITDANGCTTTAVVTITQPPAIALTTSSLQSTCGQSNGSAAVSASGGTPAYSYSWNTTPVQTTSNATGLPAGNYIVTVTDANGCTSTASVTVGNSSGPSASITTSTNVLCFGGNTGSATVSVTGGTPSYTYAWSPTGGNSSTATNLPAGNYTVIITDANGCTTTAVVTITQPPAIALTTSSLQSTCGQSNGSAAVSASGGTPAYSYSWNTTPVQTTSNATGLPAGNYIVTVTDANGCTSTASVIVGNAQGPTATISASTNVLCNGGNTGSATVNVTGGTPSYTYAWSPTGGNSSTANNLPAGNYTVIVTDANGCTTTAVVIITQPPAIALTTSSVQSTCGQSNGSATVSASGGTPTYSYSWNTTPVQTTSNASGLPAGNYTVTVTDANGCIATASVIVGNASGPTASITASVNVLCNGGNTGSATVSVTGGSSPYSYAWSPTGGNSSTANNLSAGNYTVTITDANGCTTTAVVTITQPPAIVLTTSSVQSTCGQLNGSATVSASGGTPAYSYSWNTTPVQTTSNATGLPAGNYTVTVTDANGCIATASVIVGNASGPTASITSSTNVLCNAGNDGSSTVSVTGGTPSYTYAWSPTGGNSSTANNLSAGNYTVIVTDANGCTTTAVVTITQPPAIVLITSSVQSTCGQLNGSATVSASGGTPAYSYSWNTTPVQTTSNATGLPAGNYTVTVTDANGCIATASVIVGNASGPTASITASVNVLCNGGNTGSATVSVTGGSSPYSYAWSPTGGNSTTANNLPAGNYTVIITDANGCTTTAVVTITQPPAIALTTSSLQSTCGQSNGSAAVSASGGTPAYSYSWNTTPVQTTSNATGLPAGNYIVTVTDANGCTSTANVIVGNSSGPTASISASVNVLCNGGNTGSATVSVTGGTPSYTYAWSPTGGNSSTAHNLSAGNYTVTVTDANGCTTTAVVTITQPPAIVLITSSVQSTCGQSNGSATVSASGGTPTYSYSWNTTPVQTTSNASGLPAGNYIVTVTDANGCTSTANVIVGNSSGPTASITASVNVLCNGGNTGSATVTVTGGTPSYTYAWSPTGGNSSTATNLPAGNYTVTITDANGCIGTATVTIAEPPAIALTTSSVQSTCGQLNGSATVSASGGTPAYSYSWNTTPVQTTSNATGLPAGNYIVMITDANGCTATATVTVGNSSGPTASITSSVNVLCFGGNTGSATVTVTGGTPPYAYAWSPTGGNSSTANNLAAGNYTVTITDANGCIGTATVTIAEPPAIALTTSSVQSTCGQSNGSATVSASGGTPAYSYSWNTTPVQTTSNATGLPAGNYVVMITDANGCTATASIIVSNANGPSVSVIASINISCNAGNDGSATVSVTGGSSPYSYAWSPTGGNSSTANNLPAGNYTVMVTDANGCTSTTTVTITQPPAIALTTTSIQSTCGQSNGSAAVTASGGTTPYNYVWSSGGSTAGENNLASGNYTVTVTDANGCSVTASVVITNNISSVIAAFTATPTVTTIAEPAITFSDQSTGATNWQWDFGDGSVVSTSSNPTYSYFNPGVYNVCLIASDQFGCTDTACSTVTIEGDFVVYIPNVFTPNHDGDNDIFTASGTGIKDFELIIFDRWGMQVFKSHDIQTGWNGILTSGEPALMDVYVYLIRATNSQGIMREYIGSVSLVR